MAIYVPEEKLAIQVSYSIADLQTREREVGALSKFPNVHPCDKRLIITHDEEITLTDNFGEINVIPCWKWLLNNNR